jgi:uncharacterized protein
MSTVKHLVLLVGLLFTFSLTKASDIDCFPKKEERLVYDQTGTLTPQEIQQLESKLVNFALQTSNQIVVVIVDDLCGYDKAQYATEIGDTWQVGRADKDNGIVLLVKPKKNGEKGSTYIAIGEGLEGAIPDGSTYLIVDNELLPQFRQGNYYAGIDSATTVLMQLAQGEYNIASYEQRYKKKNSVGSGYFVIIVILIIAFFLFFKTRQAKRYAALNGIDFWAAWMLLNQANRGNRGGGGGGFWGGGGGGFGGGDGGGFGGFGGGSFGGGGAGGDW